MELYNSVVEHLAGVASEKQLQQLSWPLPEFTSSGEISCRRARKVTSLQMASFVHDAEILRSAESRLTISYIINRNVTLKFFL